MRFKKNENNIPNYYSNNRNLSEKERESFFDY